MAFLSEDTGWRGVAAPPARAAHRAVRFSGPGRGPSICRGAIQRVAGHESWVYARGRSRLSGEACIAEANDSSIPAPARAARAYLDLCFFHPFSDGNARAARLALDHVLTRAGLLLYAVEPIFTLSRAANDWRGAQYLPYLVDYLVGHGDRSSLFEQ